MSAADRLPFPASNQPLWQEIQHYRIGPDNAALSFAVRLARENGWNAAYTERVIEEYRRFAFLAVTAPHPVTPSDAVDQVWHLHLTYTQDYWQRFCPMLGRDLHHGPTKGGAVELARFHEQYAQTLRSYEMTFDQTPPDDIWPSARQRLIDDPRARRVHPREGLIMPRWRLIAALTLAALVGSITTLFLTGG
jgi:hypothetical protein